MLIDDICTMYLLWVSLICIGMLTETCTDLLPM